MKAQGPLSFWNFQIQVTMSSPTTRLRIIKKSFTAEKKPGFPKLRLSLTESGSLVHPNGSEGTLLETTNRLEQVR
jgi:hypothetical protein